MHLGVDHECDGHQCVRTGKPKKPEPRPAAMLEDAGAARRDEARLDLERQQLQIEKQRFELEREQQASAQKQVTWPTVIPSWIIAIGLVVGGLFALWRFRRDHVHNLTI